MRNKSENWLSYVDRYREDGERCLRCVFSGNREECRRVVCCVIRRSEFVQCETVDFYSMFAAQITMTTEQKRTQSRVCVCVFCHPCPLSSETSQTLHQLAELSSLLSFLLHQHL